MALSDEQISLMAFNDDPGDWNNLAFRDCWVDGYQTGVRAIEAEARRDALEEAAKAVEKATYSKRWAKAAVNSHPDDVPPCEFAALIRAMMDERVKLGLPALPTKEHP